MVNNMEIIAPINPRTTIFDFGNQYLCVIGWFSPFLRSISGKKSRSILNYQQPEDTPSGKVYFTLCCFSSGGEARQKDHSLFQINPGGRFSFFAILNFMRSNNSDAKN
jgi:hypothetical protein